MTGNVADFAAKSCTPCKGGVPPLSETEVAEHHRQVPEWIVCDEGHRIERRFTFETFAEAFAFVQRVAEIAEMEGHHPDISFGWGYATVSLYTHKIKGLHDNDFIVAAKVDRVIGPSPSK
jgi:4a-hydroxytetrahydrobiopterin dehydratase